MVTLRPKPAGIERLRTIAQGLILSENDRKGPLLIELDAVHVRQAKQAFTTEGGSTAQGSWPRLSPGYARWKRHAYPGRKILVRTAEMRGNYTQPTASGHVRQWLGQFRFAFGVRDAKAWAHENAAGVPRRSVLAKTQAQYREFTQAFKAFYLKRVRQVLRHT